MIDNDFLLQDRIAKIKSMNDLYNLEENAYISFSGGKDSTVLSYIIDEALPGNSIPRVFINTGIEYRAIVDYVKSLNDKRIVIITPEENIKEILNKYGYPFKSKEHSLYVSVYQNSGETKTIKRYLNRGGRFECNPKLKYQFTNEYKLKTSNKCCYKLKKEPAEKWAKENNRNVTITGMRTEEGGLRGTLKGCAVFTENQLIKFHPLQPMTEDFVNWYLQTRNIKLCSLYYPPFNFKRTGCKGCPYNAKLQTQLDVMQVLLPNEKRQCEFIWKPVYEEYRRLGYRLRNDNQLELNF